MPEIRTFPAPRGAAVHLAKLASRRLSIGVRAALTCVVVSLASCGGGKSDSTSSFTPPTDTHRFLTQASFGPSAEDTARVNQIGYSAWIDEQLAKPLTWDYLTLTEASSTLRQNEGPDNYDVIDAWWANAVKDPAQLRQRITFALSEIFVVSTQSLANGRTVASYMDMLYAHSNGKYRDLLKAVALHPAMGQYLSHMSNRKADANNVRVPDENFAREVMQLFSIGLYQLTPDGDLVTTNGQPVESYTANDIKGMARVFTGWSWHIPDGKGALDWWICFWRNAQCKDSSQDVLPMSSYKTEHEPGLKSFLGIQISPQTPDAAGNAEQSLDAAINRLASHTNTAPFISRQLIQRLVTSNPSRAYVADIAKVFRDTDGHIGQVVKAILLHDEARNPAKYPVATYGKLREPVIRFAHMLRAVPHTSTAYERSKAAGLPPVYLMTETDDVNAAFGQTPMRAPSVFNFFRPGYRPPQTLMGDAGLVAPEMQITNEASAIGYANFVADIMVTGWGQRPTSNGQNDVQFDVSGWYSLAPNPEALIDTIAKAFTGHVLPSDSRSEALIALNAMPVTDAIGVRLRVQAAVLLVAVSPQFLVEQ